MKKPSKFDQAPVGFLESAIGLDPIAMAQKIQGLIKTPQQIWKDNAMMQAAQKKFKEVYVFNLAQTQTGVLMVTAQMLEQLFDASLTTLAPKPVQLVTMWPKNYAIIEFKTAEIATAAMQLNGIDLCGRPLRVVRPEGYEQAVEAMKPKETVSMTEGLAATCALPEDWPKPHPQPTNFLCLANLVQERELADDLEYAEIVEDVTKECSEFGTVAKVIIPRPSKDDTVKVRGLGQAFISFNEQSTCVAATKTQLAMEGRQFGENTVKATFVSQADFLMLLTQPLVPKNLPKIDPATAVAALKVQTQPVVPEQVSNWPAPPPPVQTVPDAGAAAALIMNLPGVAAAVAKDTPAGEMEGVPIPGEAGQGTEAPNPFEDLPVQ